MIASIKMETVIEYATSFHLTEIWTYLMQY